MGIRWCWLSRQLNWVGVSPEKGIYPDYQPGAGWADYREYQISQMPNVDVYLDNKLSADDILEFGFQHVVLATGSRWRRDGVSRYHIKPLANDGSIPIFTPDDIMDEQYPDSGHVVLFDDDHYYMGGVIAESLINKGLSVTLITPAAYVSEWTNNTLEQATIHRRLVEMGVKIVLNRALNKIEGGEIESLCVFTDIAENHSADAIVFVTAREGNDELWSELEAREPDWSDNGVESIRLIGDAESPAPIAWATYAGHRYARELDMPDRGDDLPFRREVAELKV